MDKVTEQKLSDVVLMTDFDENLNGTEIDVEVALFAHIKKTRDVIALNPQLIENQQNSKQMLEMYDYLIANWNSENRVSAIKILAQKEKELLIKGYINYDVSDLDISDLTENAGFFSVLAELYEDEINELDGLFSKVKDKLKKVKDKLKTIIPKINKVNPLTIAIRNALRGLIQLNFLGVATSLSKPSSALTKVKKMYKNMGGKESKLIQSITKGKKKKALFNKKMQRKLETGSFKGVGLGELGEPFTIGGMLVACGTFFVKIWNWIKAAGLKAKDIADKIIPNKPGGRPPHSPSPPLPPPSSDNNFTAPIPAKSSDSKTNENDNYANTVNPNESKAKWKTPVFIGLGILVIGGISYGVFNSQNNKKESKEIKKVSTKLGAITFQ